MVAKIGRGADLFGVLSYNYTKVANNKGNVLYTHKMLQPVEEAWSIPLLSQSFAPYLSANVRTEKPILHISLNPHPKDVVSDKDFCAIAQQYMQAMGYGEQPYVVFKHTDIERTHIHIVSVCIDAEGEKIADRFEKSRSMKACRTLEERFQLLPTLKNEAPTLSALTAVDASKDNLKAQIASVIKYVTNTYKYQSFGEYTALLRHFQIGVEKIEGELRGKHSIGLVYFATDKEGNKLSHPFKASILGEVAGLKAIEKQLQKHKPALKKMDTTALKSAITKALLGCKDKAHFTTLLKAQSIEVVFRTNTQGRIYGVSFIDHKNHCAFNGSALGKDFAANAFHQRFSVDTTNKNVIENSLKTEKNAPNSQEASPSLERSYTEHTTKEETIAPLFEYELYEEHWGLVGSSLRALFNLLPTDDTPTDYHDPTLYKKKKRKRKRRATSN